ncbi:hypothetical protein BK138_02085 [Paenibacillus rhizosphaerae]|uniref:Uncharacterized protein n=1 Tax=Paenibacillus rhizosphaerae TaxID=297318 RepID=A0A1R1F024_9BACL|nr:hypothetical protein BK138_02085 [Paenibacillus rhizosphaerae]
MFISVVAVADDTAREDRTQEIVVRFAATACRWKRGLRIRFLVQPDADRTDRSRVGDMPVLTGGRPHASTLAVPAKWGSAVAIVIAGQIISLILGVLFGTWVTMTFDWRTTFWIV